MKQSQVKVKRIGIDTRFFGPQDKGFGRYTEKLIENLEKLDKNNKYFIFLRKERWNNYKPKNPNFKKVLADYKWYGTKEQILFPLKLKKYNLDLVHFTHFNVPIFYRDKFMVTIHDLTLRKFPTFKKSFKNFLVYPFKKLAYKIVFKHAVKNSQKIIAISNHTKKDILKYYKIDHKKIKVIYNGISDLGVRPLSIERASLYKKPYLLYVGNAYPHKNLEKLILAFKKLINKKLNYQLILVGGDDYFYRRLKKHLNQEINQFNQRVIFPGFIPDKDLDIIYQNASLYVFPSLCEGFGLPSLEAMIRGVPVVCSNSSCLPEILGDAALYFDPLNIDNIFKAIKKALDSKNLRKKLINKGFNQVQKYSWQKMAKQTLNLYTKSQKQNPT